MVGVNWFLRSLFTRRWSKLQKAWERQKGGESNVTGGVLLSFLSIKAFVTICSSFSWYYIKNEVSRINSITALLLWILWLWLKLWLILKIFKHWFKKHWTCILNISSFTFSICEHSVSILAWKQILMSHFVSIVLGVLIFSARERDLSS